MTPENPGTDTLVFASPGFPHAVITLANGKTIAITAPGASPTKFYVSDLKINNAEPTGLFVPLSSLASQNSTMAWTMSGTRTTWGRSLTPPPSYGTPPAPPAEPTVSSC